MKLWGRLNILVACLEDKLAFSISEFQKQNLLIMLAKSTFFIVSSMSNHLKYQYEVGAVKETSYLVDSPAIASLSSLKNVVRFMPSSGRPPRSGAPGYS
jgi:hypothetical protein